MADLVCHLLVSTVFILLQKDTPQMLLAFHRDEDETVNNDLDFIPVCRW